MATGLSDLNIVSLFEALDIPYATGFFAQDGMGSISSVAIIPYILNARNIVLAYINDAPPDGIAGTALETRLIERLEQWDDIAANVGSMSQGGAGNASGLNYSFKEKREHLRALICLLVPFPAYDKVLQKRAQACANVGMTIPICRV